MDETTTRFSNVLAILNNKEGQKIAEKRIKALEDNGIEYEKEIRDGIIFVRYTNDYQF